MPKNKRKTKIVHMKYKQQQLSFLGVLCEETDNIKRPKKRSECPKNRPCPFVGCRYHLYLDVTDSGNIRLNNPGIDVCDMKKTCTFDLTKNELSLQEVGDIFNVSRERIRQIIEVAFEKIRNSNSVFLEYHEEIM